MTQSSSPYDVRSTRVFLQNLATGKRIEAQINPEELAEGTGANYGKQTVVGLSHQVKQFINGIDYSASFLFRFNGATSVAQHQANLQARQYLQAWCIQRRDVSSVATAGAPRLLLVWGSMISMQVVIVGPVSFHWKRMNRAMEPVIFEAQFTLEEIRDDLLYSEDVEAYGTSR